MKVHTVQNTDRDAELLKKLNEAVSNGTAIETQLETDERVLARVTDGIYRQPASALRELIANSYDADATIVSVSTDAPRFNTIKISDNGTGMSPKTLIHLIRHIGGSAKRTQVGHELGMSGNDLNYSAGGRKYIGKIGIGLFSVAQLARQFRVTTKTKGSSFQLMAHITLNRFNELDVAKESLPEAAVFQAGHAKIWAESTRDKKGHGTTIELYPLLPRVVAILRSDDTWQALEDVNLRNRLPPLYHVGHVDRTNPDLLSMHQSLPFRETAPSDRKFFEIVENIRVAYQKNNLYARLEHAFDDYYRMVWTLACSLPFTYVDGHPFSLTGRTVRHCYRLPDRPGTTQLDRIELSTRATIEQAEQLAINEGNPSPFSVSVDGVELFRPLQFKKFEKTTQALQEPVMFVGKANPDLSMIPEGQRGGSLSFSAYLMWMPKLVPQEHNGILVRINGASGTLFDSSFLKYQVGERRLEKIVGEIFVHEGLEGALNIDRESFNTAHPHYLVLTKWLHNSLRLIRNTLKSLEAAAQKTRRDEARAEKATGVEKLVAELITDAGYEADEIPEIRLVTTPAEFESLSADGVRPLFLNDFRTVLGDSPNEVMQIQIASIGRLLAAYGLLDNLSAKEQATLLAGISKLIQHSGK